MTDRQSLARTRAETVLKAAPDAMINPLTVLASPAWRGVEADIWRAQAGGASVIVKHYHPDVTAYVDIPAAIHATGCAGDLGLGPQVLAKWSGDGMFAMADLGEGWRAGGLHLATDAKMRAGVISVKKAFQAGARLNKSACIFDEIERLYAATQQENAPLHRDAATFMEFFARARQKIDACGRDTAPCHRDGNTANLMIGPDGAVQLIDFDLAANCDPFEDVGCYLVEFFESDTEARPGFEEWHGRFDEGLFQRAMLYGMADDMRWGLIGALMAATSPRTSLEFSKYAAWRFLRLEARAKRSDAQGRIRAAA
nr:phosphotransferase [uncultured Roseovarius sp.]